MGISLIPLPIKNSQIIQSYDCHGFYISDIQYKGSVIVFADKTIEWAIQSSNAILIDSLKTIFMREEKVDILLVGCGKIFVERPSKLASQLKKFGICLEWMDTGAACRTFNVLSAEGRQVAAALIVI